MIRLYLLATGELQLNAPRGDDFNGYVFRWAGCVPSAQIAAEGFVDGNVAINGPFSLLEVFP